MGEAAALQLGSGPRVDQAGAVPIRGPNTVGACLVKAGWEWSNSLEACLLRCETVPSREGDELAARVKA